LQYQPAINKITVTITGGQKMRSIFLLRAFVPEHALSLSKGGKSLSQRSPGKKYNSMPLTEFDKEVALGIKNIIDAQPGVHYTIPYLATKAAVSENRLKHLFKTFFKTTLYAYLLNRRMCYAKELLQENSKRIKAIAKLAGFKNCSNFIRAFKKHNGLTPAKYRKQKIPGN
jgi:AraC-like DNA-binding protein